MLNWIVDTRINENMGNGLGILEYNGNMLEWTEGVGRN